MLNHLKGNTYFIDGTTNIGLYRLDDTRVVLIDSGDSSIARQALSFIQEQGWSLAAIINTHCHADHIGGNAYLQEQTDCKIYASPTECWWIENTDFSAALDFGGFPFRELHNRFFVAKPSHAEPMTDSLFEGLTVVPFPGHAGGQIGIMTDDGVLFLGDALIGPRTLSLSPLSYNYDIANLLASFDVIEQTEAAWYVPSHHEPVQEVADLLALNRQNIADIHRELLALCETAKTCDELLEILFERYELKMNSSQYVLIGTIVRNHLAYLRNTRQMKPTTDTGLLRWQTVVVKA